MKQSVRSLVVFVLMIFLLTACNSNNGEKSSEVTSDATESATTTIAATTPESTLAADSLEQFKVPLTDFLMTRDETVYSFTTDDTTANILCAIAKKEGDGKYYLFEGEYRDAGQRLQYVDRAYYLTDDKLVECYNGAQSKMIDDFGTTWLKSPVKLGDKWQTEYLDKKEGFLSAVVTVVNIQDDFVEVVLQIEDDTIKLEDRYQIVKKFHKDDSVIGDAIRLSNGKLAVKSAENSYLYKDDSDYLNRLTSDKDWLVDLFSGGTVSIQSRLGRYRQAVRQSKNDGEIIAAFTNAFVDINETTYNDSTIYIDMLNYGLAHSEDDIALVNQFYKVAIKEIIDINIFGAVEAVNMERANQSLYFAFDSGKADIEAMLAKTEKPYPQAGEFIGAKHFEKLYADNGYLVGKVNDSAEEDYFIYGEFVHQKSRSGVSQHFINQIDDQYKQAKTFLRLVSCRQQLYDDYYFAKHRPYPEISVNDFIAYYVNLLTQTDEYYSTLDDKHKAAAKDYMNGVLYYVMHANDGEFDKYNSLITLNGDDYYYPTMTEEGYVNITGQFNVDLFSALDDYVKRDKDSYYATNLAKMLTSLKQNDMYYNLTLDELLNELVADEDFYRVLTPSLVVLMQDLEYFKEVSNLASDSQIDDYVEVDTLKALIDEIAPNKKIKLKRGSYVFAEGGTYTAQYARLEYGKLIIENVENLTIASFDGISQILSNDYDSVLHFRNCKNIELSGLRIGHLVQSECMGHALEINDSDLFKVNNCILFGSGYNCLVTGRVQNLDVQNSVMSDAQNIGIGLFDSENASFNNVMIAGCGSSALYCNNSQAILFKNTKTLDNGSYDGSNYKPIHAVASDVVLQNVEITEGPQYQNLAEDGATITSED